MRPSISYLALCSLVAGSATATLAFVALEIRQNTNVARSAAAQAIAVQSYEPTIEEAQHLRIFKTTSRRMPSAMKGISVASTG